MKTPPSRPGFSIPLHPSIALHEVPEELWQKNTLAYFRKHVTDPPLFVESPVTVPSTHRPGIAGEKISESPWP